MRIELTDRDEWLARVNQAISRIQAKRDAENSEYEAEWAKQYDSRNRFVRCLIGPMSRTPVTSGENYAFYPSIYAWRDLHILQRLRMGLMSKHTGAIYITGEELRAIG